MLIVDIGPDGEIHQTEIPDPEIIVDPVRESVIAKLTALGLTGEEIESLLGKV